MIKHNVLISYRSFLKDKHTFLINLVGLSTGLACVLLIYLWVQDERQVDSFHEKEDQLYQARIHHQFPSGKIDTWESTSALLGEKHSKNSIQRLKRRLNSVPKKSILEESSPMRQTYSRTRHVCQSQFL